jgi:hypothetical protein
LAALLAVAASACATTTPIILVGAMSVNPDLEPVNAIAVTLTVRAFHRLWRALRTLGVGLAVAIGFFSPCHGVAARWAVGKHAGICQR